MGKIAELLLDWYANHARILPWRNLADPYAVWVSEIMLQQTRVETVIPYFNRWMRLFPAIPDVARASEQTILSAWEGLGYYSRARNLQRAARVVVQDFQGRLPENPEELQKLPGIGAYTAGAIASMAFHRDVPIMDGNIRRILSRLFDIEVPVDTPAGARLIRSYLTGNLPPGRAGDFNQALMDLGAGICKPGHPDCEACPLVSCCLAFMRGSQDARPVLKPKPARPIYTYVGAIIQDKGSYLLVRHPSHGLLGGLWEYPNARATDLSALESSLDNQMHTQYGLHVKVGQAMARYRHAYTHFGLTLHTFSCRLTGLVPDDPSFAWIPVDRLVDHPMGKVARLISMDLLNNEQKANIN